MTVTVSQSPNVSFSINDMQQCQVGNHFIFTNTSTSTVPATTYVWDFGDGDSAFVPVADHTYSNAGSYTVTLRVINPGCEKASSLRVNVIDKPVAAFSYPPVICENQTPVIFF